MNDELVLMPQELLQPSKYGTELAHKQVGGSSFLPRLQLLGANTNLCKRGKVPIGSYAVLRGKDVVVQLLGEEVNILVISWRPKAIRFGQGVEKTKVLYNPATSEFKKIEVDSTKSDSGCMYGPEYLVYIPTANEFVTFHFNSATMRVASAGMLPNIGKVVTCRVEFIEKGKHSWHGPVILNCSTPIELPEDREAFHATLKMEMDKFNNPKEEEQLEEATDTSDSRAR